MNRVTTKTAENWFELVGLRSHGLRNARARPEPSNVIWMQHAVPRRKSQVSSGSTSGNYRVGDSWETVIYTVLWICGMTAIVLCWV